MSAYTTIKEIHAFNGHPGKFWPAFLSFACDLTDAGHCILLKKKSSGWKPFYQWSKNRSKNQGSKDQESTNQKQLSFSESQLSLFADLAERCLTENNASAHIRFLSWDAALGQLFDEGEDVSITVAIFFIETQPGQNLNEILCRLSLIADAPAIYQRERSARLARRDLNFFAGVLDLLLLMNTETKFIAAAMTLVNETAARYACTRVSLGWRENGYVRLQAISHMERFEKKMDAVSSLEGAMEESLDQDEEIAWPPFAGKNTITRDHEEYAKKQGAGHLLSIPIRLTEQPVAVLILERENTPFTEDDVRSLRILCDQVPGRLADLKHKDRWVGAKVKDALKKHVSGLIGVDHTLAKLAGLTAFTLLFLSVMVKVPYRIEAAFILRSDDVRQVSAPFDGYIDKVRVRIGQQVEKGAPLLLLDNSDLLLEESAAIANQIRFLREGEKARALNEMIEMKIAQAKAEQAQAQLALIRLHLNQSEVCSPIDGIIVEGDLEELQGAPVSKGDILFKVARLANIFVELKINESDIGEVSDGQMGVIAFVSRPQLKYSFQITQIDPEAISGETGNIFIARGQTLESSDAWWRPGMSGIAKINVGSRRIIWIITHRTVDFFQMLLWW